MGEPPARSSAAPTPTEAFELVVARWRLGLEEARAVVDGAFDLVEAGIDGPPVVELAGAMMGRDSPDRSDLEPLVAATLAAISLTPASRDRTLLLVARDILERITDGRIEPYTGASLLWRRVHDESGCKSHYWDTFIYAADEIEDGPPERREGYEVAIVDRAREILATWGPRPGIPERLP